MILIDDLGGPEGPVLLPDGSWLVTEQAPSRGCVTRFDAHGKNRSVIARTGRPNGLALDDNGTAWVAESMHRSLLRLTLDGHTTTATVESDGAEFLWPNDVCVGPDGAVYRTDSGLLISDFLDEGRVVDGWTDLNLDGRVCRYDPATGQTTTLDAGIQFTNGIAFDRDGLLYVSETTTSNIYRYHLHKGVVRGERELFGNVRDPTFDARGGVCGPDGMAFDINGNLYVTVFGQADVTVLDQDGATVRRIPTQGTSPTNVAFGPRGGGKIFVVEDELGQMEVFDVGVDGLPLPGA
jgi:gluconolactonase